MSSLGVNRIGKLGRIRTCLFLFMCGLFLSGITAFPLQTELNGVVAVLQQPWLSPISHSAGLLSWMEIVRSALADTNRRYPFLSYGTDWLAFAHLVIAVAFLGPYRDPVRNKWVVTFGLIACAGVIPLALIAGAIRQIPWGWRLVDCSFGLVGAIPLLVCRRLIGQLESGSASDR